MCVCVRVQTDQDTEGYVHTPRPAEGHPQIEDLKSQLIKQKEEMEGRKEEGSEEGGRERGERERGGEGEGRGS